MWLGLVRFEFLGLVRFDMKVKSNHIIQLCVVNEEVDPYISFNSCTSKNLVDS